MHIKSTGKRVNACITGLSWQGKAAYGLLCVCVYVMFSLCVMSVQMRGCVRGISINVSDQHFLSISTVTSWESKLVLSYRRLHRFYADQSHGCFS